MAHFILQGDLVSYYFIITYLLSVMNLNMNVVEFQLHINELNLLYQKF